MTYYELHEENNSVNIRVFAYNNVIDPIVILKPYVSLHIIIEQGSCAHIIDRAYAVEQCVTVNILKEGKLCYYMDGFIDTANRYTRTIQAVLESRGLLAVISTLTCAGFFNITCVALLKGPKAHFFCVSTVTLLQKASYVQEMVQKHACKDAISETRLYGIVYEESSLEHNGLIIVEPIAQQSVAQFITKVLTLGQPTKINAKPMLKIAPKGVLVKHGAAISPLDEGLLFFLQSRGVGLDIGKFLLKKAFLAQISSKLPLWLNKTDQTYFEDIF